MEKEKKKGFFRNVIRSIKDFDQYQDFAMENISSSLAYLFKLMLIFVAIIGIAFTCKFGFSLYKGVEFFKTDFPNLTFTNNILSVEGEQPLIYENDENYPPIVIIDTQTISDEKIAEYTKRIEAYESGLLILKDKILLKNIALAAPMIYHYEDLAPQYGIGNFDKTQVINLLSNFNMLSVCLLFFVIMFVYMFCVYLSSEAVDALFLMIFAYMSTRLARMKIRMSAALGMAVHALTLPIILNCIYIVINILTGYTIKYFTLMYVAISCIYIITAILMIKSDFMKKQMELIQLAEEQEKVREELKKKEEEEKQEQEEKERREQEKREKKKEKEEKNLPEEPEGSKA